MGNAVRSIALAALLAAAPGCGLVLDVDPPDVPPDAGGMDASTDVDGGTSGCEHDGECDDGDACNGAEICSGGACRQGEPIACDDGDACNGLEACAGGECVAGEPLECPDDGDACNGTEVCDRALGGTSVDPIVCDDSVECTDDACIGGACAHEAIDSACTLAIGGRCDPDLGCQYPTCTTTTCAGDACSEAHCEGSTCVRTRRCTEGTICCGGACVESCDDGDECTADVCAETGCEHLPIGDGRACSGDACSLTARCESGRCTTTNARACGDGEPCTLDLCDPVVGCVHTPASATTRCTDGNACTVGDACVDGRCAPGLSPLVCAERECASARCDPSSGCVDEPVSAGTPCAGGTCDRAGNCCTATQSDCDGDGVCECAGGLCVRGACQVACRAASDCGPGEECCLGSGTASGFCYAEACLACCMIAADG